MLKIKIGTDPLTDGDFKLESSNISNSAHNGSLCTSFVQIKIFFITTTMDWTVFT